MGFYKGTVSVSLQIAKDWCMAFGCEFFLKFLWVLCLELP